MKDEINLLPPRAVVTRRKLVVTRRLAKLMRRVLMGEAVLAVMIIIGLNANQTLGKIVAQQFSESSSKQSELQTEVKQFNALIRDVNKWRSKYSAWSPMIKEILNALPEGVQINSLAAGETGQITVQGEFENAEQIVSYQRKLEQISGVARVEAPLSNYSTGSNQQFKLIVVSQYENEK